MTPLVEHITYLLSLGTVFGDILCVLALLLLLLGIFGGKDAQGITSTISRYASISVFIVSLASVLGSLFYSQIAGFEPCELCWWDRVLLYPLPIIIAAGYFLHRSARQRIKDKKIQQEVDRAITQTTLLATSILSAIGVILAAYHSYGQLVNPDVLPACAATGVSCAKLYFVFFGYVAIPTMALTAFLMIFIATLFAYLARK